MAKKILVIEDDAEDRAKIVTSLQGEGYSVVEALNVDEVMNQVQQSVPDLVITDVVLPEINGYDICRNIKTVFQPHPPFVLMVTGKAATIKISLAQKMGADGFEVKTSDMAHVIRAVRKIFAAKNTQPNNFWSKK